MRARDLVLDEYASAWFGVGWVCERMVWCWMGMRVCGLVPY